MTLQGGNGDHHTGDAPAAAAAAAQAHSGLRLAAIDGRLTAAAQRLAADCLGGPDGSAPAGPAQRLPQAPPGAAAADDGLPAMLAQASAAAAGCPPQPRSDAALAALNGVLGDHLQRCGHPLAMRPQLRQRAAAVDLQAQGEPAPDQLLLLVHDLCQSDLGWQRDGHDHGQVLARALGAAAVYARYNSGLAIADNGLALARLIEPLVAGWPVPLRRLVLIGHGMGGLVARSACAQAQALGLRWPDRLRQMLFLGVPHQGLPRAGVGHWLHRVMAVSPPVAPYDGLSQLRSAGLADLREGRLLPGAWQPPARRGSAARGAPAAPLPVPLPAGVDCYAIAGTAGGCGRAGSKRSDGLVTVASALGRHRLAARRLALDERHCWVGAGLRHLDLLSDPVVYRRMLGWLQAH